MSSDQEPCDRCGKRRKLQPYNVNHVTLNLCAGCIAADKSTRSKAATGRAGRPAKTEAEALSELYRFHLNQDDSEMLDAWLADQGYTGLRGQQMRAWALETVAKARKRRD